MHSEKMAGSRESYYAIPLRSTRSDNLPSQFKKLFGIIVVVFYLLPVVSAKPTPGQQSPCEPTQHWVEDEDGSHQCINCGTCPPGQGLSIECGSSKLLPFKTMVVCVPCTAGVSFSRYKDSSKCIPCASCSKGQVVEQSCLPEWDVKCTNKCSSKERYYDLDMGDCLKCSRCCGDDRDVVVNECKEKLGDGSNMICSFDSSVNRCDQTTPQPTPTISHVDPKHDVPYTTQKSNHSIQAKDQDYLAAIVITVGIIVVLAFCLCSFFCMRRLPQMCNTIVEEEHHHSSPAMEGKLTSNHKEKSDDSCGNVRETDTSNKVGKTLTDSEEPLLCSEELRNLTKPMVINPSNHRGVLENLEDAQTSKAEDSKLLSSLLECESYRYLKKVCVRLDTTTVGAGNYRDVCFHYGINRYEIASVYEKHSDGPSRALIDHLAATHVQLTVADFVGVVRNVAERGDVAKVLEEYDSQKE